MVIVCSDGFVRSLTTSVVGKRESAKVKSLNKKIMYYYDTATNLKERIFFISLMF